MELFFYGIIELTNHAQAGVESRAGHEAAPNRAAFSFRVV
jgi:hypothetical protein